MPSAPLSGRPPGQEPPADRRYGASTPWNDPGDDPRAPWGQPFPAPREPGVQHPGPRVPPPQPGTAWADPPTVVAPMRTRVYTATRRGDDPRQAPSQRSPLAAGRLPGLAAAIIVALITMIACYVDSARQMWNDEYATVHVINLSGGDYVRLLRHQDLVHALYYTLMRLWTDAFGTSLLALRLPSMIGMAVAAGALTVLGRRLYGLAVGCAAGLVFATIPAVSRYGQEARSYAWVVALAVLSTVALISALDRPSRWRWVGYAALTVALTYLHFAAAMVLLPHALLAWNAWNDGEDAKLGWWAGAAAGVAVLAAPLLYLASGQSNQVSWIRSDWAAVARYPAELFGSMTVFWLMAVLAVVGAVRLAQARLEAVPPLLVWVLVPPVFSYLTASFAHLFLAKYALFTLPAWALLAAVAIVGPVRSQTYGYHADSVGDAVPAWAVQLAGAVAAVAVLALAGWPGQQEMRRDPVAGEPDFRAAAGVIDRQFKSGDGIVYVGTYRWARLPFEYELHRATPTDVFVDVPAARNGWFYPHECPDAAKCLGTTPRIWLVVSNYSDDNYQGLRPDQAQVLRRDYRVTTTDRFAHVRVLLLTRAGSETSPAGR